ncbi:DivIVA domain-containing protein [Flectobacillus sp. DC10W]|uniref:DivIVA domain-containing protein n=1 Tax=Flectobacillus longus TaxID=2984207 RepID=A0ABT6YI05_9BACT|nr:DivIVA domain-containing protein [Flectobacillus longus]MDI9863155.1 DivIVA domain-containing protein [Flectobacillus longus]
MRITPLEIRQHTFDKSFRGYDTESVDAFLLSLSQEWERVAEEVRVTKQLLDKAEQEVTRVKEIESSLFKTIKVAEEAQREINEKAHQEASKIIEDAKLSAESIVEEAKAQALQIEEDAKRQSNIAVADAETRASFLVEEADSKLKTFERDTKSLEKYKDLLVLELKKFAADTLDKISKFEERTTISNESEIVPTEEIIPIVEEPIVVVESSIEVNAETEELPTVAENSTQEIDFDVFDEEEGELPTVSSVLQDEHEISEFSIDEKLPSLSSILESEADVIDNPLLESLLQQEPEPIETAATEPIVEALSEVNEVVEENQEVTTEVITPSDENVEDNSQAKDPYKFIKKIKKSGDTKGLPTVSSVMEELKKDNPGGISNGGGSFFDAF